MIHSLKKSLKKFPFVAELNRKRLAKAFEGTATYWEKNYADGGNSGPGSYGRLSEFKAKILNAFVTENGIQSVSEFGCGDGNQLSLSNYPTYNGFDISQTAVSHCRNRFKADATKQFFWLGDKPAITPTDMAISLDVIFHLVEDDLYNEYMTRLFSAATRFVIVYSSDIDEKPISYVRQRHFTAWVESNAKNWSLIKKVVNPYRFVQGKTAMEDTSMSDFFIYALK